MTTHANGDDASTERAPGEVEYERRGREMVQELESFLPRRACLPAQREDASLFFPRGEIDPSIPEQR